MTRYSFGIIPHWENLSTPQHIAIRILLLVMFAGLLYQVEYREVRDADYPLTQRMELSLNAANLGEYFYYYPGTTAPVDPNSLWKWSNTTDDYGPYIVGILPVMVVRATVDGGFQGSAALPFQMIFAVLVITALLICAPNVPLPISIAGMLMFFLAVFAGPITLETEARSWGVTFVIIPLSVVLAMAPLPKRRIDIFYILVVSGWIGFLQFFRQESIGAIYGSTLATIVMGAIFWLGAYMWRQRYDVATFSRLYKNLLMGVVPVLACTFIAPYILRLAYAQAWDQPYAETTVSQHGAALPLYLGTFGFARNPFNIGWLDTIGLYHLHLHHPETDIRLNNPIYDEYMLPVWQDYTLSYPWIVLDNLWVKVRYMDTFLRTGDPPYPAGFLINDQSFPMQVVYWLLPLVVLGGAVYVFRTASLPAFLMGIVFLALLFGASLGPLTGHPSYIGGAQGALLALVILFPAAVLVYHQTPLAASPDPMQNRVFLVRIAMGFGVLVGVVLLAIGLWVGISWRGFNQELARVADQNPLEQLQAQEHAYGIYFNSMSVADQQNVVDQFLTTDDPQIYRTDAPSSAPIPDSAFRTVAIITTPNEVHALVWLGEGYPVQPTYINQARISSIIQLCVDCTELRDNFVYDRQQTVVAYINDFDWTGHYRLFSFAMYPQAIQDATDIRVGLQHLVSFGGTASAFGYQVEDLYMAGVEK